MKRLPLTPQVLVAAYANGIFPMDVEGEIQWFSPDPRAIIPLDAFSASKTCLQTYRSGRFEIRINTAFEEVMRGCSDRREGTWISEEIVRAYCRLHELGLAHSVESWRTPDGPTGVGMRPAGELAGGLYGVAIGGAFCGESMFSRQRDASKVALVALVERMRSRGFTLLDVQFTTPHLQRFGAVEISRDEYLERLKDALAVKTSFVD
ncbi:MAG: leucyl/phenylalanyl-tRNA--protein transferase [Planctomycetes bacterium]|nr:leucyl/phenylalanyl-tRNA--protein transferase [Planctomycetota bacterium]